MKPLLPQSLFARMALILLGGMTAAQVLSAALSYYEHAYFAYRAERAEAAKRIAGVVSLLDLSSASGRLQIAELLDTQILRVSLDGPPVRGIRPTPSMDAESTALVAKLRTDLGNDHSIAVTPDKSSPANPLVQVSLRDGTWVTFRRLPMTRLNYPYWMLLERLVLFLAIVLLLLAAVRWVTRPLSILADAAEDLGKNIHRAPLAETGPLEVRRAAREFNRMQVRLVHYLQVRTRALAAISHDLKTPITRLRLRAESLSDGELKSRFVKDLEEMESMVAATLDFMRGVDRGEAVHRVDIMALLESLQADAEEMGGQIRMEGTSRRPYRGEPRALKRCIGNLLDNAVKYGRYATIIVDDGERRLQIRIQDEGPGIPQDKLEQVMEPFSRLDESRSRNTGGAGLGLTIARSIAEAHGGELTLHNRSSGGLEARLVLPRSR